MNGGTGTTTIARSSFTSLVTDLVVGTSGETYIGRELHIKSIEAVIGVSGHANVDGSVYCALYVPYNPETSETFANVYDPPDLTDSAGSYFPHLRIDEANFGWVMADSLPRGARNPSDNNIIKLRKNFRIPMKVKFNGTTCLQNKPVLLMTHLNPVASTSMHACVTIKYYDN